MPIEHNPKQAELRLTDKVDKQWDNAIPGMYFKVGTQEDKGYTRCPCDRQGTSWIYPRLSLVNRYFHEPSQAERQFA